MRFRRRNSEALGDLICGNLGSDDPKSGGDPRYFPYRSSTYITEFFQELDTEWTHDDSTRHRWVADVLDSMLSEPHDGPADSTRSLLPRNRSSDEPARRDEPGAGSPERTSAAQRGARPRRIRGLLRRRQALLPTACRHQHRHRASGEPAPAANGSRGATPRNLTTFLDACSEDDLIEEVLLPLFRQLGFHRITAAGHKDKALEYGKDIWMRFTLPTQHYLYFGIQAKKGKIDASGVTKTGNANVAELHNQALMMLAHEIFDPETNKRVLVDHAFIVAGGQITKAARNWIGNALDASKRSQIMFIDRDDILNLYVVTNLPLPAGALPLARPDPWDRVSGEPPF